MAHPKEFAEGLSIGIIMDGNGRWAKNRGLPRTAGHKKGAAVFKDIANYCDELGVASVYFYAFSTENWKRPLEEVGAIMKLFAQYLIEGFDYKNRNIRIKFLGDRTALDPKLQKMMNELEGDSACKTGMTLNIAINYGGPPHGIAHHLLERVEIHRCSGGAAASRKGCGRRDPPRGHQRADDERCHVHRRTEGPGLYPASQRRKAAVQLHALAGCLFGAGGDGCALAGLYPCRSGYRH